MVHNKLFNGFMGASNKKLYNFQKYILLVRDTEKKVIKKYEILRTEINMYKKGLCGTS